MAVFVGHGLLAFALVGLGARRYGLPARRALVLAIVAGLFGTVPDVDILYGPIGLLGGVSGIGDAVDTFWATGNVVHRGPTHSILLGIAVASGVALAVRSSWRWTRAVGGTVLGGVVGLTVATSGGLDGAVVSAFVLAALGIALLAVRLEVGGGGLFVVALVGLVSHPFGDLLTGAPPDFLYPLDVVLVPSRLSLHADGTIHLLGAFAVELAIVWVAVAVFYSLTDRSLTERVDRRAALGAGYGAAVFVLPAPTVDTASPFVFSVLSLGIVGALVTRTTVRPVLERAVATGLAAVTCAIVAYAAMYLLV